MKLSLYDIVTGEIKRHIECLEHDISIQCGEGESYLMDCPTNATFVIDGKPFIPEPIPPTEAEIIASLTAAVQGYLDSEARTHNYDGILSLCSYATSLDTIFKAEAQAGVEWRDACWRVSYQVMVDVKAGLRQVPTSEGLIAELPTMVWPT